MKVFTVCGYWNDNKDPFDGQLVAEVDQTPDGYQDEDIFFYGLTEAELIGNHGDFEITSYKEVV